VHLLRYQVLPWRPVSLLDVEILVHARTPFRHLRFDQIPHLSFIHLLRLSSHVVSDYSPEGPHSRKLEHPTKYVFHLFFTLSFDELYVFFVVCHVIEDARDGVDDSDVSYGTHHLYFAFELLE